MPTTSFLSKIEASWRGGSLVCVGLDPNPQALPPHLGEGAQASFSFCRAIIDATADKVCAFKPQIAWFSAFGHEDVLVELIDYIHAHHQTPVILDAKRGDIGETCTAYAIEAFDRYRADAVTVSPYLGLENLAPFTERSDKGVFVLCRTSNPHAEWLQNHPQSDPTYLRVVRAVVDANTQGNLMLVAGATHAKELARIRGAVGDMPLLVPGIGAQGGDLSQVIKAARTPKGGLIINASRSIASASKGEDFADAARKSLLALHSKVQALLSERTDQAS